MESVGGIKFGKLESPDEKHNPDNDHHNSPPSDIKVRPRDPVETDGRPIRDSILTHNVILLTL